tara:strand:- start:523 stop:624 length:102 start_codon:yes stop_codon:yes gene_type:complete
MLNELIVIAFVIVAVVVLGIVMVISEDTGWGDE